MRIDTRYRLALVTAGLIVAAAATAATEEKRVMKATFAGGCFWCMQPSFDATPGVVSTVVGYTGGTTPDPTYEQVLTGKTGHAESIEVTYDPGQVTYQQLVDVFWRNIDPTQRLGQFADHGSQYRTAIFYHDDAQRQVAEASKAQLAASGRYTQPILTEVVPAAAFYPAEAYHQKYYEKNAAHYNAYKVGSGRAGYLKKMWGDQR